jgi:hypothetical protein
MKEWDRVHDRELLDRLEALEGIAVDSSYFRVGRAGRDPTRGYAANGRWSKANELEVLYTAEMAEGALAEIGYRMALEPIWPSKIAHEIAELKIKLDNVCDLSNFSDLGQLGIDVGRYESYDYHLTQAVSAAVRFLEFDALLVPNARHSSNNLVVYTDLVDPSSIEIVSICDVDWTVWRSKNRALPSRR